MALTGLAIAAALALAKDELIDQPAANKKRKLAAATAAYSPWTGMKPDEVNDPNVIGDMMIAGAGGAATGASVKKSNSEAGLNNSLANNPSVQGKPLQTASADTPLGGGQMSNQIGENSNSFVDKMNKSMPQAADSAAAPKTEDKGLGWYPEQQKPGDSGSPGFYGYGPRDQYASIRDAGMSPDNPENQWSINPFQPSKWGQPGYNAKGGGGSPWGF